MESCGVMLGEGSGLPKLPGIPEEKSAMAAQVWRGIGQVKLTVIQTQPLMVKILPPPSKLTSSLTSPMEDGGTNPLRPPWRGGHPSGGGGTASQGRLIEDGRQSSECV